MFRLNKLKSEKYGERFDFKFSNLHALQVPKGWDKLYVSVISVQTGKTLAKSRKASVRNGSCQWTESISKSICTCQGDASKETEECLVKLVVAMGSARSGVLGEATINLASYRRPNTAIPISFPLKKCNHGTILQVKIQCLSVTGKLREEKWEDMDSNVEDVSIDYDHNENKSDVSDGSIARSVGLSSRNHLDTVPHAGKLHQNFTFSVSSSQHNFDSMEGSMGRETYSSQNELAAIVNNQIGRQDSAGSPNSFPLKSYSFDDYSRSSHSSFSSKASNSRSHLQNQRDDLNWVSQTVPSSLLQKAGSSKDLLEAAEVTIEELRAVARMWEQNARKLMTDIENLQKELLEQSKRQTRLEMELSESLRECDSLKQEIEQCNILLEESIAKQQSAGNLKFQGIEMDHVQKELEDELKFQKESNVDLASQLKKTQVSNIELVSILQELEDTIEKQKIEIDDLSKMQSNNKDVGKRGHGFEDNEEVKPRKPVSAKTMRKASCDSDLEGSVVEHKLGDLPSEDSRNLQLEIWQLQESQKNLVSTVQFLEKSLAEKIHELGVEQSLKTQTVMDLEADWSDKFAIKEDEIVNLKQQIEELERDCNELMDKNLELLLKLKDSTRDLPACDASSDFSSNKCLENGSLVTSKSEASGLKTQICKLEEELNMKKLCIKGPPTNKIQLVDLTRRCAGLELQLQASKDKTCYLDGELCTCHARAEEQESKIAALQQQLEYYQQKETKIEDGHAVVSTDLKISESLAAIGIAKTLSKLDEQIQLYIVNVKKEQYTPHTPTNNACNCHSSNSPMSNTTDLFSQIEKAKSILNSLVLLKDLFDVEATAQGNELQQCVEIRSRVPSADEVQSKLKAYNRKENPLSTFGLGAERPQMKSQSEITESLELLEKISEIDKLKSDSLLKEQEVEELRHCQRELETQISNLQNEKRQLEENMEAILRQGTMTSKYLDELRNEMMMLSGSLDSQGSANKILERKSSELESGKYELEVQPSELEKENVPLSERICGLEAQLRYLTDDKELGCLELQNSESCVMNLWEQIRKLESELEAQRTDMKHKLQDMQKQWFEAQAECRYLKMANTKLQTTAETLVEEFSLLQKSYGELRKQNMELHQHCTVLEVELRESEKAFSDMFKEVEALEGKYTSMLEEIASKEKALNLELDALLHENKKHKEKFLVEESLLEVYLEKTIEVENLQREVALLTEQISATQDEKERTASEALHEVSRLRGDKTLMKALLLEVQGKLKSSESNLSTLHMESETKLLRLMDELAASKQNQEVLMADNEKLLGLLEDVKSNEQKHRSIARRLELKLKASQYERLQVAEEISSLKVQLQRTSMLQDEILSLQRSLNELKFENERLEASLQVLSGDYEELKTQKILSVQKISDMQRAVSELEDCKSNKVALQEKVLLLEGELTAREALGSHNAELKNELARVKRANGEFQRKIRYLEEEKKESMERAKAFENELKQRREAKQDEHESGDANFPLCPEFHAKSTSNPNELMLSDINTEPNCYAGNSLILGADPSSKIHLLETQLSEALETNDMYKAQLKSLLVEGYKDHSNALKKNLTDEGKTLQDGYEGLASTLEKELRDLQERYLQMSLKCAEVEAEREQLVQKLKAVNNGKSWFSQVH